MKTNMDFSACLKLKHYYEVTNTSQIENVGNKFQKVRHAALIIA
jgi:hypothetical protein